MSIAGYGENQWVMGGWENSHRRRRRLIWSLSYLVGSKRDEQRL